MTSLSPEWFNYNRDAIDITVKIARLLDISDNMIDKDKPVPDVEILEAFLICLYHLPLNPVYRALESHISPMWLPIISSYDTANYLEKTKDPHGIEIGHTLRYAVGHIFSYIIAHCVGIDKAREYIPQMWKIIVGDRFEEYRKEHLDIDNTQPIV